MSMYHDYRPASGWGRRTRITINDDDRDGFVQNDEAWYRAQRRSGLSRAEFVRRNRAAIDEQLRSSLTGGKRP